MLVLVNYLRKNQWPLYAMSFCMGHAIFYLKLTSLQKLVESLSLEAFPILLVGQGILILLYQIFLSDIRKKYSGSFNVLAFILSIGLVSSAKFYDFPVNQKILNTMIACAYFLLSTVFISWLESAYKMISAKFQNTLYGPLQKETEELTFEVGVFVAAGFVFISSILPIFSFVQNISFFTFSFFLVCLGFLFELGRFKLHKTEIFPELLKKESSKKVEYANPSQYPFVMLFTILLFALFATKNIQSFAVLLGMIEMKTKAASTMAGIFSKITLLQNFIIIMAMIPAFLNGPKSKIVNWGKATKLFFVIQMSSMIVLVVKGSVFFLIATGIGRKLISHLLLSPALAQFMKGVPLELSSILKSQHEKWAQAAGLVFVGIYSSLTIYGPVPHIVMWFGAIALSLVGLWVRKMLVEKFNEHQVSHVQGQGQEKAIQAIILLGDKEASSHAAALINLLEQRPDPVSAKMLCRSLGAMLTRRTESVLMEAFAYYKEEEVRCEICIALMKSKNFEIDLFMRKQLVSLINDWLPNKYEHGNLYLIFAKRMEREVLASVLDVLEHERHILENENDQTPHHEEKLAFFIKIFGKIMHQNNKTELAYKIQNYLEAKFSKKIQASAIYSLYRINKYTAKSKECLDCFLTSPHLEDKIIISETIGNLGLIDYLPFVLKLAAELEFKEHRTLISLLTLKEVRAAEWLVAYLRQNMSDERGHIFSTALWQLTSLQDTRIRFAIYQKITEHFEDGGVSFFDILFKQSHLNERDMYLMKKHLLEIKINAVSETIEANNENPRENLAA